MIRPLAFTPAFLKDAKRVRKGNAAATAGLAQALAVLTADAYDPRLRTHKLGGKLSDSWSCTAGYDLRLIFEFITEAGVEAILLTACGTHDEVY